MVRVKLDLPKNKLILADGRECHIKYTIQGIQITIPTDENPTILAFMPYRVEGTNVLGLVENGRLVSGLPITPVDLGMLAKKWEEETSQQTPILDREVFFGFKNYESRISTLEEKLKQKKAEEKNEVKTEQRFTDLEMELATVKKSLGELIERQEKQEEYILKQALSSQADEVAPQQASQEDQYAFEPKDTSTLEKFHLDDGTQDGVNVYFAEDEIYAFEAQTSDFDEHAKDNRKGIIYLWDPKTAYFIPEGSKVAQRVAPNIRLWRQIAVYEHNIIEQYKEKAKADRAAVQALEAQVLEVIPELIPEATPAPEAPKVPESVQNPIPVPQPQQPMTSSYKIYEDIKTNPGVAVLERITPGGQRDIFLFQSDGILDKDRKLIEKPEPDIAEKYDYWQSSQSANKSETK